MSENQESNVTKKNDINHQMTDNIVLSNIPILPAQEMPPSFSSDSKVDQTAQSCLPMIINLQGDEEFFHEFDMNADEVMDVLNIKRSRLNQISGKELRVGRAKIGRYIRPLFRCEDVNNYKNWTRATATHKKSQEVIDGAVNRLESYASELADSLATDSGILSSKLNTSISNLNKIILENLTSIKKLHHNASTKIKQDLYQNTFHSRKNIETILTKITEIIEQINLNHQDQNDMRSGIAIVSSVVGNTEKKIETVKKKLSSLNDPLDNIKSTLLKTQDHQKLLSEHLEVSLKDILKQLNTDLKEQISDEFRLLNSNILDLIKRIELQQTGSTKKFKAKKHGKRKF